MIDFVKIKVVGSKKENWTNNPLLDFKGEYHFSTGEASNKIAAEYNNMVFKIFPSGLMLIQGSLHKYYNFLKGIKAPNQHTIEEINKGFNGTDFNCYQLAYAINHLKKTFCFNSGYVTNAEIGLNIKHSFETELILNGLMMHKGKCFNTPLNNSYRRLEHSHYKIKCYNKALQYGMDEELIRFEIHYNKSKYLKEIGLVTIDDFLKAEVLDGALNLLLIKWWEILMYDYTINEELVCDKVKSKLKDYKNVSYWRGIMSNHLDRPKKHYKIIEGKFSQNISGKLSKLMINKWSVLSGLSV